MVHAAFGGSVVGLADEKGGQQNPVAEVEMEDFDNDAGRGHDDGEAGGMAEDAGFEIELAENGFADIAELGVSRAAMRVLALSFSARDASFCSCRSW